MPVGTMFAVAAEGSLFERLFRGVTLAPKPLEELRRLGKRSRRLALRVVDVAQGLALLRRRACSGT